METYPITARSLGLYFKVDGNNLERAYKDHLSGFCNWEQASHAEDWVLHQHKEDEVLNYFINRLTNAHAESLNSKLKGFTARNCQKKVILDTLQCIQG